MKIKEIFEKKNLVVSLEIFPPNNKYPIESIYDTVEELSKIDTDYISVTYGAGGTTRDNRTLQLTSRIKNIHHRESLAHLTSIASSKEEINKILDDLKANNIRNILALRGDRPEDNKLSKDFSNSQDLIRHIKSYGDFGIAAACYPEGHMETRIKDKDIEVMKFKEEAGADYFITQLFYENNYFYGFLNKLEQKGIKAPVQAGVMPVVNLKQVKRTVELSGASLPEKFKKILDKYEHDEIALRDAGIAYAIDQIVDLVSSGVRGIHLYTMNNPYIGNTIINSINSLVNSINGKK